MEVVYGPLGVETEVCLRYGGSVYDVRELLDQQREADGWHVLEIELPGPLNALEEAAASRSSAL